MGVYCYVAGNVAGPIQPLRIEALSEFDSPGAGDVHVVASRFVRVDVFSDFIRFRGGLGADGGTAAFITGPGINQGNSIGDYAIDTIG
jgi:hypothetical protein